MQFHSTIKVFPPNFCKRLRSLLIDFYILALLVWLLTFYTAKIHPPWCTCNWYTWHCCVMQTYRRKYSEHGFYSHNPPSAKVSMDVAILPDYMHYVNLLAYAPMNPRWCTKWEHKTGHNTPHINSNETSTTSDFSHQCTVYQARP